MASVMPITSQQINIIDWTKTLPNDLEGCGVCEKELPIAAGRTVGWFSHQSAAAHSVCHYMIHKAESTLSATLNSIFKNNSEWNLAHREAVMAVKLVCDKESHTILSYFEEYGEDALVHLFSTVGIEAVKKYATAIQKEKEEGKKTKDA